MSLAVALRLQRRDSSSGGALHRRRPSHPGPSPDCLSTATCSCEPAASTVNLADWRDRGRGDSQHSTVVSEPPTAAETVGVVMIDTVLPYEQSEAAGTGMVLTASGQVLTNRAKITWVDPSGNRHTATVTLAASPVA
jgi:hypothetical protein